MNKTLTVKQFNQYFKIALKHDPFLNNVSIRGEVINYKLSHSHIYFALKEDEEIINCVLHYYEDYDFDFKNGDDIEVNGNLIFYSYSSNIFISVRDIKQLGKSDRFLEFEVLKNEFLKKGYFDDDKKKKIPEFPTKLGIVTSDKGAAIKDFLKVTNSSYNKFEVFPYPVKVQGLSAKDEIIKGLKFLDEKNLDLLIITRGGGSYEDLSVFNEKDLVECIFRLNTPIISAIGHQIDYTLADFVSDYRASTPTDAANVVIRNFYNISEKIDDIYNKINEIINLKLEKYYNRLSMDKYALDLKNPYINIERKDIELENLLKSIKNSLDYKISSYSNKLEILKTNLDSKNRIIELRKKQITIKSIDDKAIFSKNNLKLNDKFKVVFSDGEVFAKVIEDER